MDDRNWTWARLIPVSGISNEAEAEQRATSALLAVLRIVRPFSKALLSPLGASKADRATVETFIEVSLKSADGRVVRPDGLIRVSYGSKAPFVALVEVKTGNSALSADQVNTYWDLAREHGFDCVITISNEIAPSPGVHPIEGLKVRANSKVKVHHYSWTKILSEAVMEKVHRGVDDPEQAWILGELIRYLEHTASGALQFDDMGPRWVEVRDAARDKTLKKRDEVAIDIAQRWDQMLRFAALKLGSEIGSDVQEVVPRRHRNDPKLRTLDFADSLSDKGCLSGSLRVPNTVGDIDIDADIRARQLVLSAWVDAPADKGARGRVTWLTKQLDTAPPNLVVEAYAKNSREPLAVDLASVREDPTRLVGGDRKEAAKFRLCLRMEMGVNRKSGRRLGFVDSVLRGVDQFYGKVLQDLRPYQAAAPKLRRVSEDSRDEGDSDAPGAATRMVLPVADEPESRVPVGDEAAPRSAPVAANNDSTSGGAEGEMERDGET